MAIVVLLACILVSGLEWYAVARIGRLKAQNAELLRRLESSEKDIASFAATCLPNERFDEEKKTTDLWREEVESTLGSLRTDVDEVVSRFERQRAAADDRIAKLAADTRAGAARLETARRAWDARISQVRREIPAPFDTSAITDLKKALAALDRQVGDVHVTRLRRDVEALERRLDSAVTRLDLVEASVHDHPDLARTLDSIDQTVRTVFTYVLRELDDRVTMALTSEPAGAATVRGALLTDSDALRTALSHLFEDYAQGNGATIRLRWGGSRLTRYYLDFADLGRFSRTCVEALESASRPDSPPDDGRPPGKSLRPLLLGMGRARSGFAQIGPLALARTQTSFVCGVLEPAEMLAFDSDRCLRRPDEAPAEISRRSGGKAFDVMSLAGE